MVGLGWEVDYLLYGDVRPVKIDVHPGITVRYQPTLQNIIDLINKGHYDHIIRIRLMLAERPMYIAFVRRSNLPARFHTMALTWPTTVPRALWLYLESYLSIRGGRIICASKRLYHLLTRAGSAPILIMPPVPSDYFVDLNDKSIGENLRIVYLGHLNRYRCIDDVLRLFTYLSNMSGFVPALVATHDPRNTISNHYHGLLSNQQCFRYISVNRQNYSPELDDMIKDVLREADVLVQPYSTLDSPLVILESMASLCLPLTTRIKGIPELCGSHAFIAHPKRFFPEAVRLLSGLDGQRLVEERRGLFHRSRVLGYDESAVRQRLFDVLG